MSGWHLLILAGFSSLMLTIGAVLLLLGKDPWRAFRGTPLDPAAGRRFGALFLVMAIVTLAIFTAVAFGWIPTEGVEPIGAGA